MKHSAGKSIIGQNDNDTKNKVSPIYLFADSQLLFWKTNGELFLKSLLVHISSPTPIAAYIGASNGDQKAYYEIFELAMNGIGINQCGMVSSDYGHDDKKLLETADIIVLAGGDTRRGCQIFKQTGMNTLIHERHKKGVIIIGISAGAMQLGASAVQKNEVASYSKLSTLKLVPLIIDTHDEKNNWSRLKSTIELHDTIKTGFGIPLGTGLIYYPDSTLEILRDNVVECVKTDQAFTTNLISPPEKKTIPKIH